MSSRRVLLQTSDEKLSDKMRPESAKALVHPRNGLPLIAHVDTAIGRPGMNIANLGEDY
jgi:hypothetical protein